MLEARFPETMETYPELLAHHYTEVGLSALALPYWQRAGQRAIERSATVEAVGHLTKGLELLKTLPETPERNQQELTMQLTLGASLLTVKSQAALESGARLYPGAGALPAGGKPSATLLSTGGPAAVSSQSGEPPDGA